MRAGIASSMGVALGAALLCAACARDRVPELAQPKGTPPEVLAETERLLDLSLDHWIARAARIQRISQEIRLAGRELCAPQLSAILGVAVVDPGTVPPSLAYPAWKRFGDGPGLRVVAVFEQMAAERAGLRVGDTLLEVGSDTATERTVYRPPARRSGPLRIEIEREGVRRSLEAPREPGCMYPARLSEGELVNAWADGSRIWIDSALARLLADDHLLAAVIGHEIAHNIHIQAKVDSFRARGQRRLDAELRADYVGAYLAARAGYSIEGNRELHVAMLRDVNRLGARSRTHPTTHARTLALRKTLDEIEQKRRNGEPLVPTAR